MNTKDFPTIRETLALQRATLEKLGSVLIWALVGLLGVGVVVEWAALRPKDSLRVEVLRSCRQIFVSKLDFAPPARKVKICDVAVNVKSHIAGLYPLIRIPVNNRFVKRHRNAANGIVRDQYSAVREGRSSGDTCPSERPVIDIVFIVFLSGLFFGFGGSILVSFCVNDKRKFLRTALIWGGLVWAVGGYVFLFATGFFPHTWGIPPQWLPEKWKTCQQSTSNQQFPLNAKMRNLECTRLEMDEIWGYVGKKEKHIRTGDDPQFGNVWTFCAIDAETKLVPAFHVAKERDVQAATAFVSDVADRLKNRVQISTDGLAAYVEAIENAFGEHNVDYGQIVKTYGTETSVEAQRRYSAPKITESEKKGVFGYPDWDFISTSYVERLNATTRLHMKRLARLTHAFSKKRENFEAAVGLHFAYYNFVRRHNSLRCTPAMAAGVESSFWSVADLVEAAA